MVYPMKRILLAAAIFAVALILGYLNLKNPTSPSQQKKLFVAGFAVPADAITEGIVPAFQKQWADSHAGENVEFDFSWGGSSVQARNVISGLEADVVFLSDWTDVDRISKSGLIAPDWNSDGQGIVSKSVVVFRVKPDNPLQLKDWPDLLKPGIKLLTPNPKTSGSARWNILALYGTQLRRGATPEEAQAALVTFYGNVVTFGESGRATTQDFERGVGDVALTYENEVLNLIRKGAKIDYVVPPSTIIIENSAAVVDEYAARHGVKDVADGFLDFLRSAEGQRILASYGFRPVHPDVERELTAQFPIPPDAFDIAYLGGWPKVEEEIFAAKALWDQVVRASAE